MDTFKYTAQWSSCEICEQGVITQLILIINFEFFHFCNQFYNSLNFHYNHSFFSIKLLITCTLDRKLIFLNHCCLITALQVWFWFIHSKFCFIVSCFCINTFVLSCFLSIRHILALIWNHQCWCMLHIHSHIYLKKWMHFLKNISFPVNMLWNKYVVMSANVATCLQYTWGWQ